MRVVVFGAAGRTGRLVVEKALGHGHDVVAVVYRTPLPREHARLTVCQGDVRDQEFVRATLEGADAVVFAVSSDGSEHAGVHEGGIANVLYGMAEHNVPRLAVMSAAGVFARSSNRLSILFRLQLATRLRHTYDDLEAMERRVMASGVAWSIVRPYGLADTPATGHYRVVLDGSLLPGAKRISRGDVASLLMKAIETDTYIRHTVVVSR